MTALVDLQGVTKRFGAGSLVLDRVSIAVEEGSILALLGASGSGKTTALRLINRLTEPDDGAVIVLGKPARDWDVIELRRRIGYVIQEGGLFPHFTVERNVGLVPERMGWPETKVRDRVHELLSLVGLEPKEFATRAPRELSGGQRQRVGLARALAADPPLLLFDEPFGALDPITRRRLQDEFRALVKRLGKTALIVTHDLAEACRIADEIVVLHEGRVAQRAAPHDLRSHPAPGYVASYVAASLPE
ncbi:MAG: ATP-binding cassette domain-containing protein [Vicinamibacteria bacterium]